MPQLEDTKNEGYAVPQKIPINKSSLAITGAVVLLVVVVGWALHLLSVRQAKTEPYIRAAVTYVQRDAEVAERVGALGVG